MKKFKYGLVAIAIILGFTLVDFAKQLQQYSVYNKPYNGTSLEIAVIGDIPNIREQQINFYPIDFDTLIEASRSARYDAIIITEQYFQQASQQQYAEINLDPTTAHIFIEAEKGQLPFVSEELTYEDVPEFEEKCSAVTLINGEAICYAVYNDAEEPLPLEYVYSQVLTDISQNQ